MVVLPAVFLTGLLAGKQPTPELPLAAKHFTGQRCCAAGG
jgi:hypothetical protein